MNKPKIGKGDPIINELEEIMQGKDYPIELITLICKEKDKSYKFGYDKFNEQFLEELEKKFNSKMQCGLGYTITKWEFEIILNKYRK